MITTGYTKLFASLVGSSIWRQESKEAKILWITMLAMANSEGVVTASIPGLADFAKITLEECKEALKLMMDPDEWSRSPENEGRKIEEVSGGWRILNYEKYRNMMNADERRQYLARKQREYRERLKMAKEDEKREVEAKRKKLGKVSAELLNGQPLKKQQPAPAKTDEIGEPPLD